MLIGLNGGRGHGKNAVCDMLRDHFGSRYFFVEESFAMRLKLSAARCFFPDIDTDSAVEWCDWLKGEGGVEVVDIVDPDKKELIEQLNGREFLQRFGTEAHRNVFGENFWVDQVLPPRNQDGYENRADLEHTLMVITDARFENEARRVREYGGQIWRIFRESAENGDTHASEIPLPDQLVDVEILNDGSLDDLSDKVFHVFTHQFLLPEPMTPDLEGAFHGSHSG